MPRDREVEAKVYRRQRFAAKYTPADIALPAQVDRAHERLSGPATQRILKREYAGFGKPKFAPFCRSQRKSRHRIDLRCPLRRKPTGQ